MHQQVLITTVDLKSSSLKFLISEIDKIFLNRLGSFKASKIRGVIKQNLLVDLSHHEGLLHEQILGGGTLAYAMCGTSIHGLCPLWPLILNWIPHLQVSWHKFLQIWVHALISSDIRVLDLRQILVDSLRVGAEQFWVCWLQFWRQALGGSVS